MILDGPSAIANIVRQVRRPIHPLLASSDELTFYPFLRKWGREMTYVPKLKEEEALLLTLKVLIDERKGQATVREIKELIQVRKLRPWSGQDAASNALRSGAPIWHQIVQNASDRLNTPRHFYRVSFIRIVSSSPDKILQITDDGRKFVDDLRQFEERLSSDGFKLYEFLDESPLEENWTDLKKVLSKNKITYGRGNERDDLLRSLRS